MEAAVGGCGALTTLTGCWLTMGADASPVGGGPATESGALALGTLLEPSSVKLMTFRNVKF